MQGAVQHTPRSGPPGACTHNIPHCHSTYAHAHTRTTTALPLALLIGAIDQPYAGSHCALHSQHFATVQICYTRSGDTDAKGEGHTIAGTQLLFHRHLATGSNPESHNTAGIQKPHMLVVTGLESQALCWVSGC